MYKRQDANLTNHVNVSTTAATPVMVYTEEDDERNCMDVIEEEFVKRYPITARTSYNLNNKEASY